MDSGGFSGEISGILFKLFLQKWTANHCNIAIIKTENQMEKVFVESTGRFTLFYCFALYTI